MSKFFWGLIAFLSLFLTVLAKIQLLAQDFKLADDSVRNVKLIWTSDSKAEKFRVYRKSSDSGFQALASGPFRSYDDYDVPEGPHSYQVFSLGVDPAEGSNVVTRNPLPSETLEGFSSYDNIKSEKLDIRSKIHLDDTYYEYHLVSDKEGMSAIKEFSSLDGYTFEEHRVVLTRKEVCTGSPKGTCKLESLSFVQNPTTTEVVMWAHWEEAGGYGKGEAAIGYGRPGQGSWKFGGSSRPLGHDSRDLAFFVDVDQSGYVISSTNTNRDMNIYRLTPDWHQVKELVATVLKGQAREAPAMIHHEGMYYLFTSIAAGWYPSTGKYISASNIAGPWSENQIIGNLGGFSAQSGEIVKIGSSFVMRANKWRIPDIDPEGTPLRQVLLIISVHKGAATCAFYPEVLYRDTGDNARAYGVQNGRIVSVGKPVASTGAAKDHPETLANSGVNTRPRSFFQPTSVPFIYAVDLGAVHKLRHIELTTFLTSGSEAAAQFIVEGSLKANGPYKPFLDQSNNTRVGFVSAPVLNDFNCRYVVVKVQNITNMHNKRPGRPGVHEFTVFAEPLSKSTSASRPSSV
ncbi:hypothetical protein PTTG_04057 [Puccinia triticina 1-1 BBBD Race 1]|uniref:F5/8 type C domain-containing protein n=1 Tax=Puccinia triticina (isolate 1-1 / race 1 (BBBD)) TaxID=630390 RepID=A0A0C4ETC8_PUCT1|nr:hypothetical protein PTTG_04057 [Puccinia triticina 1-1 BBBD Race 1]